MHFNYSRSDAERNVHSGCQRPRSRGASKDREIGNINNEMSGDTGKDKEAGDMEGSPHLAAPC